MLENLENNDIVITKQKKQILKYLSDNKKILNLRIMTLKEFKDTYFGYINEQAIYYLIKKYNYRYEIAKMYLDNFLFLPDLKKELEENNLIIKEPLFKEAIKRIVVIDYDLDPYIKEEIEKYDHLYIKEQTGNYLPPVYEFDQLEEEVNYVALKIIELLKTVSIDHISLVNVGNEYEMAIKRIFSFYNIPINLNIKKTIYGTLSVQQFIKNLKETKNIDQALSDIKQDEIYNAIVDICNKYQFKELDDIVIYMIEQELKNKKLSSKKLEHAINIVDIDEINSDNYYFILGFNQGILPMIYKDEDYLSDKKKSFLGILTSLQKNILEKEQIKTKLTNYKNIYLSYKLSSNSEEYYKSSLIDELGLEIKKDESTNYNHSVIYNKLNLACKLDKLIKFNEHTKDLNVLYSNYPNINYLTYDNKYQKIDKDLFLKYIDNKILLSYSSIDNYYRCGFKYYINNILKLNKYEETFMTFVGNLFHYILSLAFNDNFDFEQEFSNYIKDKELSNKEQFFISKLKKDLLFVIETIKEQDQNTSLDKALYEQKVYVNKDKSIKITFMGIIDKLKYEKFDNKTIVAIIDYKTGTPEVNLNNTIYGIQMQLPIYLYLAKNSKLENVEIAGFYLQKIVHNKLVYQKNDYEKEVKKLYRLDGYSNSNTDILSKLDTNYTDSNMIKGMKTSSKGFYQYTKVLETNQIDKLIDIVDQKIDEATTNILDANFDINPKKIGQNLVGCEFCSFKDICYKKEGDIVYLEEQNYKDFLGGDNNA